MNIIAPMRSPIEQLPPNLYETISTLLFSSPTWPTSKCEAMVTNLFHYATIQQSALNEGGPYAKIAIPNLLKMYQTDRQWQQICCYQTLHIFLRLLCALGILKKQCTTGQPAHYLLPLDPTYLFEATPPILAALDRLCDPLRTKNIKLRKKASDVKLRLLHMNPLVPQRMANEHRHDLSLTLAIQRRVRRLIDSLGLSVSVAGLLFQGLAEICTDVVRCGQESPAFVDSPFVSLQPIEMKDAELVLSGEESPSQATSGDSIPQISSQESPLSSLHEDSSADLFSRESPDMVALEDSEHARFEQICLHSQHIEHKTDRESPLHAKNLRDTLPSSIDSSQKKDSLEKDLELEGSQTWVGSEEDLHQEALRYLQLFDGPQYATAEYVRTHAGKKALGGYSNKIRRSPWLARVSAINTLLQRTFYDLSRQKKPLEKPGKWFHASFDRYADSNRPMEITGEILDWARSSYTLEDIARMLPLERKRQETQWLSPEPLHRPFSSCACMHQPSLSTSLEMQGKRAESDAGNMPSTLPYPHSTQGMDYADAKQLAKEIGEQASWYLEQARVRREPTLGEQVYVVEATIAGLTLSHVYTCRADWWQEHEKQVEYQTWEQQFEEGLHCATHST